MFHQLAWAMTNLCVRRDVVEKEDDEIYAYGFECIVSFAAQLLLLLAVGLVFGKLFSLALYTLGFMAIKQYIGGWHARSHFGCLGSFTAMAALANYLLFSLLPVWLAPCFVGVAAALVLLFGPVEHPNKPKTAQERAEGRRKAVRVTLVAGSLITLLWATPVSQYALYTATGFLAAAVTMIIPNKGGDEHE